MTEPMNEGRAEPPDFSRQFVRIDPELWQSCRIRAISEGRAVWKLVQDALQQYLDRAGK